MWLVLGRSVGRRKFDGRLVVIVVVVARIMRDPVVGVLRDKYAPDGFSLTTNAHRVIGSPIWRAILKATHRLAPSFHLKLGSGEVSFFFDRWLESGLLCDKVLWVATQDVYLRVRDVWYDGDWHFDSVHTLLPSLVRDDIRSSTIMLNDSVPDCYAWKGSINGIYSVKEGYAWLLDMTDSMNNHWGWIWKLKAPQKICFFIWLVCHQAIPTNSFLLRRCCVASDTCGRCRMHTETVFHCLRDCPKATSVWSLFGINGNQSFWHEDDVVKWIRKGIVDFNLYFLTTLWWIWRARCEESCANQLLSTHEVIHQSKLLNEDVTQCFGQDDKERGMSL
ncbi:hypothetical protein RIF29_23763 [Crotalaria pallida]|uniref:Reverse transcriptase zinc-binding domain-containing protein n=1 Tax=Crotalaria pallida TaxID=3830 RepID=A0AAN9F848_CROPI